MEAINQKMEAANQKLEDLNTFEASVQGEFRRREFVANIVTSIISIEDGDQFESIANRVYEWIYKEKA